jgi:hypothetical protein
VVVAREVATKQEFARLQATCLVARALTGLAPERAWREASYLLWLRWLNGWGAENLEGQEQHVGAPLAVAVVR